MRKVLVILDSLCVGGRERIVVDLCNSFDPEKYSITFVTLSCDNNPFKSQLNSNIGFYALPFPERDIIGLRSVLFLFKGVPRLISYIKQYNPDIIHTHSNIHRLLLANIAIKGSKVSAKIFHSIHTSGLHYSNHSFSSRIKRLFEKVSFLLAKPKLIGVSAEINDNNKKFYKNYAFESRCIPNGVDLKVFDRNKYSYSKEKLGLSENELAIVYPARLVPGKNHITLLKAFKKIRAEEEGVKLVFAGDGEMRTAIENYVQENQLERSVVLLGNVTNIPEILSVADIGAFPSEYEGFGIGLIEMMAMGIPVVASDIQVFNEFIDHMNNGVLYPTFDSDTLASMLLLVMRNNELRTALGVKARETAQQFSLERSVNGHITYYES
ncbi:glycosyltransferase [uncultured Chitinophaga sp.]|jgi:Glycosyltransferase|uniref:glycosyltransferase n=1 Tax=uncultured Chitinophaga sp. TaxID=339340 RepID=UPI002610158C|nr:glycosyltransferase [uncultured Chitinophaga sp.]